MTRSQRALGVFFIVAGIMHFVMPAPYVGIMPPWLPSPLALVYVSGVFEIAGGAGVMVGRTRRAAGWGLIALLVAVFPANIQMLVNALHAHASPLWCTLLVLRLPLQPLMIWWVHSATLRRHA